MSVVRSLCPLAIALAELDVGEVAQVVRIGAPAGGPPDPELDRLARSAGLLPGTRIEVRSVARDGAVSVRASKRAITLPAAATGAVLVRRGDLDAASNELSRVGR